MKSNAQDEGATAASVLLPSRAAGATIVEAPLSKVAIEWSLAEPPPSDSPIAVADGIAVYEAADSDVAERVYRTSVDGVEDFLVLAHRPDRDRIRYVANVSRVAGLRLVDGVLELLDAGGTPRLRMGRPWLLDGRGVMHEVSVTLDEGCPADNNPLPPWGRPIMRPARSACDVVLEWSGNVSHTKRFSIRRGRRREA